MGRRLLPLNRPRSLLTPCRRWVATASCLLAVTQAPLWAGDAGPAVADWTIDNARWTGTLAPETKLEVVNQYGDVRLRAADAGEVETSAMVQRRTSDPVTAELEIDRHGGVLRIEVVYPKAPQGDLHRVDIAVFVPAGAPVVVRTRDGMIQARGLANDLELESAGGNLVVATSGTVTATTGRGDITAELDRTDWSRAPRLSTGKGDITLTLPAGADARVRIHASGEISVKAPARLERGSAGDATVTFGRGTHSLSLETRHGGVTVLSPSLS